MEREVEGGSEEGRDVLLNTEWLSSICTGVMNARQTPGRYRSTTVVRTHYAGWTLVCGHTQRGHVSLIQLRGLTENVEAHAA